MERRRCSSPETRSTSHSSSEAEFEVFLSFRGPDTRATFADSLYHALLDKGIRVFVDKKGIDVGEEIGPEIFEAIDDSKICIPIFSKGYASSSWCLRELEHMMERRKTSKLEVMPIFYDVEPSDVKLETELYRDALTQHKKERGAETVQCWEQALKEVTKIKGWDTKNTGHGELARSIAQKMLVKLKSSCIYIFDQLVGMDKSVNEVEDLLNVESKDVRLIGIWGMGGIGKTTLAKVVYHKLSTKFESCSFISNIREVSKGSSGLSNLQGQLVSDILGDVGVKLSSSDHGRNMIKDRFNRKKVLIILDDVDHRSQLIALAAKSQWFGMGSRIVVTTRDRNVLSGFEDQFEPFLIYEAKGLDNPEALQLFSKHAFRSNSPPNAYMSLSKQVTEKTGGLPLAIEVMGSLLHGKKEAVWKDKLEKMKYCPHEDVKENLMLSYEVLDDQQRQIFLDIAFFGVGPPKDNLECMWEDCGFFPNEGIDVLLSMSLVKITKEYSFWMHDQLKDLGQSIVYKENRNDPRKGSRVWNQHRPDNVQNRKGTETVAAYCSSCSVLTSEDFIKMPNIRYLSISYGTLSGDFDGVLSELRWLNWDWCPAEMQVTNFCPKNLVILDLSNSRIDEHWGGWTQLKVARRLKVLDLSFCDYLKETPDLSAYLSLELLTLQGCTNLLRIDPSIGHLKHLESLVLEECERLQVLPVELSSLEALTMLAIEDYKLFENISQVPSSALANLEHLVIPRPMKILPDWIGMMKGLVELDVSCMGIVELPDVIVNLKSLKVLDFSKSRMQKLPEKIGMLEKLEEIYGEHCLQLEMIPSDIVRLPSLKILTLTQTRVQNVPPLPQSLECLCLSSSATEKAPEISNLANLRNLKLCFTSSKSIEVFPSPRTDSPCCMLELPNVTSISSYLDCLCYLEELELINCKSLCHIGQLPSRLRKLTVYSCDLLEVVDLSNLSNCENLWYLKVQDCPKLIEIQGLDRVESLESLYIGCCSSLRLPDLSNWKKLEEWDVDAHRQFGSHVYETSLSFRGSFRKLTQLHIYGCLWKEVQLDGFEQLIEFKVARVELLEGFAGLSSLKRLKLLTLWDCRNLTAIQGLGSLESLEQLDIVRCPKIESLDDLSDLKKLERLEIHECQELVVVKGLDELETLKTLRFDNCRSLRGFFNVINPKVPGECFLTVQGCPNLEETPFGGSVSRYEERRRKREEWRKWRRKGEEEEERRRKEEERTRKKLEEWRRKKEEDEDLDISLSFSPERGIKRRRYREEKEDTKKKEEDEDDLRLSLSFPPERGRKRRRHEEEKEDDTLFDDH